MAACQNPEDTAIITRFETTFCRRSALPDVRKIHGADGGMDRRRSCQGNTSIGVRCVDAIYDYMLLGK